LQKDSNDERYRWVILPTVYISQLSFSFVFQSIPPVLPLIASDLQITYAQSGLLTGLFALPGLFISLVGGFLSDRYRMKSLAAVCFAFMVVGTLLVGLGRHLSILLTGRIIVGIGGFILSILLPKILSLWFAKKELGVAMGVFNTGVPLGSIICFGLFGVIGSAWGWRVPVLLTALYTFFASALFLSLYRSFASQPFGANKPLRLGSSLRKVGLPIWWVGLAWLWFNAGFISFVTFAPDFFIRRGYLIGRADLFVGIPALGSLFLSTPVGYLIDRYRHQEWFIGVCGLGLSVLTFSFLLVSNPLPLVVLMALFAGWVPTSIYSLPPTMLTSENAGLGFGVLSTCSSLGLFGAPYLVGKIRDLAGSDTWTFVLISLFYALTTVSIVCCHRSLRQRNIVTS
jgi:predicted MFS family arabinose efflux permease